VALLLLAASACAYGGHQVRVASGANRWRVRGGEGAAGLLTKIGALWKRPLAGLDTLRDIDIEIDKIEVES